MPSIQSQKITPYLWFDHDAEGAAYFYTSIFRNSHIGPITRYGSAGVDIHGRPEGSVKSVTFQIEGQEFIALNGGPAFRFNEAVSFSVGCDSQAEVDYYWERLSAGGDESAQQCGWLKDKYGVSWQIVPTQLLDMVNDPDVAKSDRVMTAMLRMKKLDLAGLRRAYAGA